MTNTIYNNLNPRPHLSIYLDSKVLFVQHKSIIYVIIF